MAACTLLFLVMSVLFFNFCENKKSLENFIKKKSIQRSTITILNTANDEINYTWIEYQYLFDDSQHNLELNATFTDSPDNDTNLNIYFNNQECKNSAGKFYSKFIENLLEVLVESDDIQTNFSNETDRGVDLFTCPLGRSQEAAILKTHNPLYAILTSRFALIYKKQNKAKDIFVLTFVGTLWLVFLVILFALAVCLRISTHYYSRIYKGRRWSWVEITLWAIAAACQQGLSYTPSRITSRIFFLLGYVTSYVLYTAFTAAITSVLVQQETVDVTVDQFNVIGYGVSRGNQLGPYKIATHTNNLTRLFEKIDSGANIGLGPLVFFDIYISTPDNPTFYDDYKVIPLERSIGEYKKSFLLRNQLRSQRKLINQRLIKLFETGIIKQIEAKSLKPTSKGDFIEGYSSATIEHVKSAILLFLIGVGLSLIFLIMELGVYGYRHR